MLYIYSGVPVKTSNKKWPPPAAPYILLIFFLALLPDNPGSTTDSIHSIF